MAIDDRKEIQLTFFDVAMSASPAWSPDGREIAFICNQGGTPKLWVVNADGGTARSFDKTNASDTNSYLAWSPNHEIVYQQPRLHNLRRLNPETQNEGALLSTDSHGWLVGGPNFSPDGKKFAILWNRGKEGGIWIVSLNNHLERSLFPGAYWPLGWSPDAKFILAYAGNGAEIFQKSTRSCKRRLRSSSHRGRKGAVRGRRAAPIAEEETRPAGNARRRDHI
jgi:Tol biopolymer transport system component